RGARTRRCSRRRTCSETARTPAVRYSSLAFRGVTGPAQDLIGGVAGVKLDPTRRKVAIPDRVYAARRTFLDVDRPRLRDEHRRDLVERQANMVYLKIVRPVALRVSSGVRAYPDVQGGLDLRNDRIDLDAERLVQFGLRVWRSDPVGPRNT